MYCLLIYNVYLTPGLYTGTLLVKEGNQVSYEVPVELDVRNFALPDESHSKTMLYLGFQDIGRRYTGQSYPNAGTTQADKLLRVRDRHFQMAKRHRVSLIDENNGVTGWGLDQPRPEWVNRLNGNLYTPAQGYDGPGVGVGNDVYSIHTYGHWGWKNQGEAGMRTHTDAWEGWFQNNFPDVERFLYLQDEPLFAGEAQVDQVETWASWVANNPGVGGDLMTFVTAPVHEKRWQQTAFRSRTRMPSVDIVSSWIAVADNAEWESEVTHYQNDASKRLYMYNGRRPASGSFATEDDGVALRELPWAQYKKKVDRWYFWESTYYTSFQFNSSQTNVFQSAQTFGGATTFNSVRGESGVNSSNGDGVLFYPGTDTVYSQDSYGVEGPIASLRLKHWRRGIQDVDYLELARQIDPVRVDQLVNQMVPKALWEVDVSDHDDATWSRTDISWSTDPEVWEAVRKELADIIEGN